MGNTSSDRPLVRIHFNLKDCFVSHCCVVTPEEEEGEESEKKIDEEDGNKQEVVPQYCVVPPEEDNSEEDGSINRQRVVQLLALPCPPQKSHSL